MSDADIRRQMRLDAIKRAADEVATWPSWKLRAAYAQPETVRRAEERERREAQGGGVSTVLGLDPDTKATGIAIVENGVLDWVGTAVAQGATAADRRQSMARELHDVFVNVGGIDVVVIEWQNIRPGDKRPNDILELAAVAGMALSLAGMVSPTKILTPLPVQWKGTVDKKIHQSRTITKVGLRQDLTLTNNVPINGAEHVKPAHRTHVIDAIGLALWGYERSSLLERVEKRRKAA